MDCRYVNYKIVTLTYIITSEFCCNRKDFKNYNTVYMQNLLLSLVAGMQQ